MSERISDEPVSDSLLQGTIEWAAVNSSTRHIASALRELQRSRALVTELRALAERMRESRRLTAGNPDKYHATDLWLSELTSLLAAHDAQQAEGKGE